MGSRSSRGAILCLDRSGDLLLIIFKLIACDPVLRKRTVIVERRSVGHRPLTDLQSPFSSCGALHVERRSVGVRSSIGGVFRSRSGTRRQEQCATTQVSKPMVAQQLCRSIQRHNQSTQHPWYRHMRLTVAETGGCHVRAGQERDSRHRL